MKSPNILFFLKKYAPVFLFLSLLAACASPPDYPIVPAIEFNYITKDTLRRGGNFEDTTFINFSFTDGDGDIGDRDSVVLFIEDSRNGFVEDLKIPFVPELGASNGIKGEITAQVFTSCCVGVPDPFADPCNDVFPNYPYDEIIFTITMKDRAGNVSNEITTTPVYIRCF